jgi:hypothetical protein
MNEDPPELPKPPYLSFVTLKNFLSNMKKGVIPTRIDKHAMPGLSGGAQSYLLGALRFFRLIDDKGVPHERLHDLVFGDDEKQKATWMILFNECYHPIMSGLDLERAGVGEVLERFGNRGFTGETLKKCQAFFVSVADAAGVELAPHLKTISRSGNGPRKTRKTRAPNGPAIDPAPPPFVPSAHSSAPKTMAEALLAKFPDFSVEMDAKVQGDWFAAFNKLMTATGIKEENK